MRGLKIVILVAAFIGGSVLTLARAVSRAGNNGAGHDSPSSRLPRGAKHWARSLAVLLLVGALGGGLVVVLGLIPIKASSGHWTITAWFLNFTMERSVATHSLTIRPPTLDHPGLVVQGATHYDFGCRPCHGAPEMPQPVIAQRMTPAPPYLPWIVSEWKEQQLFYIVKHGVKFTGMPAWPTQQRDDEVWAMVAFLRQLAQLTPEKYHELTRGEAVMAIDRLSGVPQSLRGYIESCARCHGADGRGRGLGVFPVIAGQRPAYLAASLLAYARGERQSGIMQPLAAALPSAAINEVARYYGTLQDAFSAGKTPPVATARLDSGRVAAIDRGREIATRGIPRQRLPACATCHGPGPASRNPIYPQLAGQYSEYLALQLNLLKSGKRGGTPYAHIMVAIASRLNPEQINDVALYYSSAPDRKPDS